MSDKQTHSYVTSSVVPNRRHRPHLTFTCHCSRLGGGFAVHTEHAAHCGYTWVLAGRTSQFQQKKKDTRANTSARQNKRAAILNDVV